MALQLMKLQITASSTIETAPQQQRYFYVTTADTAAGGTLSIDAASFFDDAGQAVVTLPDLAVNNSIYNVYINGIIQMDGISTYTPGATAVGSLAINVPTGGEPIISNSPIVLEIINFDPASTVTLNT